MCDYICMYAMYFNGLKDNLLLVSKTDGWCNVFQVLHLHLLLQICICAMHFVWDKGKQNGSNTS